MIIIALIKITNIFFIFVTSLDYEKINKLPSKFPSKWRQISYTLSILPTKGILFN